MTSYEKRTWWSRHGMTDRLKGDTFLEAAITSAFLIAAADGQASEEEYDALLDRLEILGGVDRDAIDDKLTAATHKLEASGFEPLIARVAELLSGDRQAADATMMLSLAVALADDDVSMQEREIATQLAAGLGIDAIDLDALLAEIRG